MAIKDVPVTKQLSSEELRAQAAKLLKEAEAMDSKVFDDTINFLNEKLRVMNKTKMDAVIGLCKLMKITGKASAPIVSRLKEKADLDSSGERPEVGVTYKLPNGKTWTRAAKGAAKKEFVEFAKPRTWASMKA